MLARPDQVKEKKEMLARQAYGRHAIKRRGGAPSPPARNPPSARRHAARARTSRTASAACARSTRDRACELHATCHRCNKQASKRASETQCELLLRTSLYQYQHKDFLSSTRRWMDEVGVVVVVDQVVVAAEGDDDDEHDPLC